MSNQRIKLSITTDYYAFIARYGLKPNGLLVSSNAELALNSLGLKPGDIYIGMRIVSAEFAEGDTIVALLSTSNE